MWGHATINLRESIGFASEFIYGAAEFSLWVRSNLWTDWNGLEISEALQPYRHPFVRKACTNLPTSGRLYSNQTWKHFLKFKKGLHRFWSYCYFFVNFLAFFFLFNRPCRTWPCSCVFCFVTQSQTSVWNQNFHYSSLKTQCFDLFCTLTQPASKWNGHQQRKWSILRLSFVFFQTSEEVCVRCAASDGLLRYSPKHESDGSVLASQS